MVGELVSSPCLGSADASVLVDWTKMERRALVKGDDWGNPFFWLSRVDRNAFVSLGMLSGRNLAIQTQGDPYEPCQRLSRISWGAQD